MKIKHQLLLALSGIFILFLLGVGYYAQHISQTFNEFWAQRLIEKQLLFDKNRTLQPILHEIALVKQLVNEPAIRAMALNDLDPTAQQDGLAVFEHYRALFQDKSYFAAFQKTRHYYYNDALNSRANQPLAYTLNPQSSDDQWFFRALHLTDQPYQINVNKDTVLGVTKVWINHLLIDQNQAIAVIGTGLTLDRFLKQNVEPLQPGIRNLFINENLSIQLDKDPSLISYASFVKPLEEQENLNQVLTNPVDLTQLKALIKTLKAHPNQTQTFWTSDTQKPQLVGVTYLPEIHWYNITLFDESELVLINTWQVLIGFGVIFLGLLVLLFEINHRLFILPLNQLTQAIHKVREGDYEHLLIETGYSQELENLTTEFNQLIQQVKYTQDTLAQKVIERTKALADNETKLNSILDIIPAHIFIKDNQYHFLYANKALQNQLNRPLPEILGKTDADFFDPEFVKVIRAEEDWVLQNGEQNTKDQLIHDDQGKLIKAYHVVKIPLKHEDGSVYALCGISWDVTEQKLKEQAIQQLALYDSLTQLPNRRLLLERIQQEQTLTQRKKSYAALVFLDLDNFKPLNDRYGHELGDQLLYTAGQRLKNVLRETDTVARFGGDEFTLVLSELGSDYLQAKTHCEQIAQKILQEMAKPYELKLQQPHIQQVLQHTCPASLGITLFKGTAYSPQQLINHADQAMYVAKKNGKNQYHLSPFSGT